MNRFLSSYRGNLILRFEVKSSIKLALGVGRVEVK